MNPRPSASESAWQRGRRDFVAALMGSPWAWAWSTVCTIMVGGLSAYLLWDHARAAQVLITSASLLLGGLLSVMGILAFALAAAPFRQRNEARRSLAKLRRDAETTDGRPVCVLMDQGPIWHNFHREAHVVEFHVTMRNQANHDVFITGFLSGPHKAEVASNPRVAEEIERRERDRPQLFRHRMIERASSESGWVVKAFPCDPGSEPELPPFSVGFSGYGPMEALPVRNSDVVDEEA